MSEESQVYFSIGYCLFMLILMWVFRRYPPKKINHVYGYRTSRSMMNQDVWDEANRYSSGVTFNFSLYSFVLPVVGYFLLPKYNFALTVIIHTLLIVSVYFFTEKHLKTQFDENGNRIEQNSDVNS